MRQRAQSSTSYPNQFLLVLSIDHISPATGKTPTVTLSKNGAAYGAAAGAVTEIANGVYSLTGNATDRNTLGELWAHITATGCDTRDLLLCDIITTDVFAANQGIASVTLAADQAVNTTKVGGTTQTARDLGASVLLSVGTGTGQVNLSSGAVPVTGDLTATMKTSVTTAVPTAVQVAAAVWAYVVEGSFTALNFIRLIAAALGGKVSGADTATVVIRDASDTKTRITATVDAFGNRSAVTLDGS